MATIVLNGSGTNGVNWTNNTGQNARVIINYMTAGYNNSQARSEISLFWENGANATASGNDVRFGKNLAFSYRYQTGSTFFTPAMNSPNTSLSSVSYDAKNMIVKENTQSGNRRKVLPTEIMISNGGTFSAICDIYNILIITES